MVIQTGDGSLLSIDYGSAAISPADLGLTLKSAGTIWTRELFSERYREAQLEHQWEVKPSA